MIPRLTLNPEKDKNAVHSKCSKNSREAIVIQERRRHRLYLTRNTEYHLRGEEVVGVRDRKSGQWLNKHKALRARLMGCWDRVNKIFPSPMRGGRLHLVSSSTEILTSPLMSVQRPHIQDPEGYISNCWSGEIVVNVA